VCDGSLKPTPTPTPGPSGLTLPKIIDFWRDGNRLRVRRRLESFSATSDFCSEIVFLVLTASCEVSFLALEKHRKTSKNIEKHRKTQHRKMFQIQVCSEKLKILCRFRKENIFPRLTL
jgi:hypothetical protein